MEQKTVIGKSVPRIDAYDKVTGRARYTADLIPSDALCAKILHATIANGRVKRIDTTAAQQVPGVVKVVTCFDVPAFRYTPTGNPWTLDHQWQDIQDRNLLTARVRYYGDNIAAVVALDEQTARAALEKIQVEYEVYDACFDAEESMRRGGIPVHEEFSDNVFGVTKRHSGDFDAVVAEPGLVRVEGWYSVPPVKHCQMEPPVSYAYEENGRLVVVSSTQMPHVLRRVIGQALGIPWAMVRVVKPVVGGGFGNKDDALYEPLNAFLCRQVGGRCVRLELSREEDFYSTVTRHAMRIHLVTYARRDGTLAARSLQLYSNGGAYASHGHAIASKGVAAFSMLYRSDAYRAEAYSVYTNLPCAGAMRGYGAPQITFALEAHMDDVSKALSMDPIRFRRKTMMLPGTTDGVLTNYFDSLNQCLDRALAYMERHPNAPPSHPHLRQGTGAAIFWYRTGVYPFAQEAVGIRLSLNQDGSVLLHIAENEIGQGADTAFAQMTADAVGLRLEQVHVVSTKDTDVTPFGTGAYASRQTYVCGMAIAEAGEKLRQKILAQAGMLLQCDPEGLTLVAGDILAEDGSRLTTVEEVAMFSIYNMTDSDHLTVELTHTCKSNALTLGCCVARVETDLKLGTVRVLQIVNVHDCGRLINPALAEAQVHGGISMGLGYALGERLQFDSETGRMYNGNLLDYKCPTAPDHPPLGVEFVQNPEPTSPFGTKGLGEPPTVPVAPAIRNAVLDATGVAINVLPLDPQRCLKAFQAAGL